MLTDPENFEEWEFEVRATDLDEARKKCEVIAAKQQLTEILSVSQATVNPYKNTYRFICWFRSEVSTNDSSDNS